MFLSFFRLFYHLGVKPCLARLWPSCRIFWNLQFWQLVTLQVFSLERPPVPLWKDLDLIIIIISSQETFRILKIGFALWKRPHLHRAYRVSGPMFFPLSVLCNFISNPLMLCMKSQKRGNIRGSPKYPKITLPLG